MVNVRVASQAAEQLWFQETPGVLEFGGQYQGGHRKDMFWHFR